MQNNSTQHRHGERGAALITMLLVATLILAAGGALIVSTATSATNAVDASTEKQAFYAAEAGLQLTVNALRGNMQPDVAVAANTTMNFRTAVTPDSSNGVGRNGGNNTMCGSADANNSRCRLAGWLPYSGDKASANALVTNGALGFRVSVYDPDDSQNVTFTKDGQFTSLGAVPTQVTADGRTLCFPDCVSADREQITYVPGNATTLNNAVPSAATDFGSYQITRFGAGVAIPLSLTLAKFDLTITQSLPWSASTTYHAQVVTPSVGFCPNFSLQLLFPQPSLQADGTTYLVTGLNGNLLSLPCLPVGGAQSTGQINAQVSAPQPKRLLVRSWGFGPKWSQKRLEMMVDRANLSFQAPATITVRGADNCAPMTFDSGNSNAKTYSGTDHCRDTDPTCTPGAAKPAFAVTGCDESRAEAGITKPGTVSPDPKIGILDNGSAPGATMSTTPVDTPDFLKTADAARTYLNELEAAARSQGRYFTGPRSITTADGTAANPNMTFVDGDCTLGDGVGGLVVCTGNVTTSGNISFDGVLLVMGAGSLTRGGGGSGNWNGSVVVSAFARTWPADQNDQPHPFLAPTFNTNGGGNSDVNYNSTAVTNAMNFLGGPQVAGVLEY